MVTAVVRPDTTVITEEEKVIVCCALNIVQLNWQAAQSAGKNTNLISGHCIILTSHQRRTPIVLYTFGIIDILQPFILYRGQTV